MPEHKVILPAGYADATPKEYNKETDPPLQSYSFTDWGNAQRFELRYAGKFYWTKATKWLYYDNGRWHRDDTKRAEQAMIRTLRLIPQEGEDDEAVMKWAHQCKALKQLNSALKYVENLAAFVRNYENFDQHPELFACANGVINLNTGEFGPHKPEYMLTKASNVVYDPAATCPLWDKFLMDVMEGREHMVRYLARASGYTLTADTGGQCLFVPYGPGGTGKSQFLIVQRGIMGDYCRTADAEMFMSRRGDSGQPFEMAGLEGVRGLYAIETEANKELACAKVKRMTGQDPIRACYKHCDWYEFVPSWKIWLATNDRPKMDATDDAMWDRPKLIPFDVKFRGTDKQVENIGDKIVADESSGVLNWMLQGLRDWRAQGLNHPKEVIYAVQEWRGDEDYFSRFIDDHIERTTNPLEYVTKANLFEAFGRWSTANKEGEGVSNQAFNEAMKRKGYQAVQMKRAGKNTKVWFGIKYNSSYATNTGDFSPNNCDPNEILQ